MSLEGLNGYLVEIQSDVSGGLPSFEVVGLPDIRVKDLSDDQVQAIRKAMEGYKVEGDLKREVALNIKRLTEIGCFRGMRHKRSLPVRGQRTKTNARTRKGPRKVVSKKSSK